MLGQLGYCKDIFNLGHLIMLEHTPHNVDPDFPVPYSGRFRVFRVLPFFGHCYTMKSLLENAFIIFIVY
jgi:hypothetical protein